MSNDTQQAFDLASQAYSYRLPYHTQFFQSLSSKLGLRADTSRILDICCGNGQISVGLSDKVKAAVAMDFSEGMLSLAEKRENIRYVRHDINVSPLPAEVGADRFDDFVIGRAIHWIKAESLAWAIDSSLKSGGSVVVCGTGWSSRTKWLAEFETLRRDYSTKRNVDFRGAGKLAKLGFDLADRVDVPFGLACSPDFLLKHALSYSSSVANIQRDLANFSERLAAILKPFVQGEYIHGVATSWALIYRARA